jgi:hypothetical protein
VTLGYLGSHCSERTAGVLRELTADELNQEAGGEGSCSHN